MDTTNTHFDTLSVTEIHFKLDVLMQTRNLIFWHDGACISNHSHLMIMVSFMFDPVVYLTDDEYFKIHGKHVNVQCIVEKPYLYILPRCHSDDSQLLYSSERLDDLLNLNEDVEYSSKQIRDIVRAFKGDNPACQFKAGQQKNGDYFCWQCPLNAEMAANLVYTLSQPNTSLEERINKMKESTISINKIKQNNSELYKNLKKHEIAEELHQRGIRFFSNDSVSNLQSLLDQEMAGIQRLSALLFPVPNKSLVDINLQKFEILDNEPLHDISHTTPRIFLMSYHITHQRK